MQSSPRPTSLSYYLHLLNQHARLPAPPRPRPDAFIWHCVAPSSIAAAAIRTATPSSCTAEKAVGGVYLRVVPLRTAPTPSPRCRCPPRWSVAYDHHNSARDPPHDLELATDVLYRSATPSRSTPRRRESRPTCATRCMRCWRSSQPTSPRRLPAHRGSSAVYCRLRLRLPYSLAPPSPPPACAVRAMVVPHRRRRFYRVLARQVRLQQIALSPIHTHAGRIINTARPTPLSARSRSPSPAPRLSPPRPPPPGPTPHYPPLKPSSCPAPEVRRAASPERAASATSVPVGHAAFNASPPSAGFLCAHASRRYKPRPAAHANTTGTIPRDAQHTLQLSPHHPIPSPLPMSILRAIPPRSLTTPPHRRQCAARRAPASHRQRLLHLPRSHCCGLAAHGPHGGNVHPALPPVPAFHARDLR
ncbi:hypothetical protein B0H14DRAFT_3867106 [Mycena olivaceomarginata]|nr:hypothetical protein B0H14DRAFT_3867106 [Mycena olivaceomarginata]